MITMYYKVKKNNLESSTQRIFTIFSEQENGVIALNKCFHRCVSGKLLHETVLSLGGVILLVYHDIA